MNLGLRILGRRADGYHELESLFAPLDWGDALELRVVPGGRGVRIAVAGEREGVPEGEANLAERAARAFLEAAGVEAAVEGRLEKRVPAASGLGGGSSDAAAVLRALARRLPGALAPEALRALALRLGADVPFFLDPRPVLVTGIGERMEPVEGLPALPLLLVHPGEALSTAAVYAAYDAEGASLTPERAGSTMHALSALRGSGDGAPFGAPSAPEARAGRADRADRADRGERGPEPESEPGLRPGSRAAWASLLENDLEPAARRLCPALGRLREALEAVGAAAVGLSGSGPTLYGVFEAREDARRALEALGRRAPARGWVVTTRPSPAARTASGGASPNR